MDHLLVKDIWKQANGYLKGLSIRTAVIAYVTKPTLKLYGGDVLICDASKGAIEGGLTSAKTLNEYFQKGVKIYSVDNLHAKFVYTSKVIICGSSNLSSNTENLVECAVVSQNNTTISQAKAFVYGFNHKNKPLTESELDTLLKIKVIKRPNTGGRTRRKKNYDFGNGFWIMRTNPMRNSLFEKEKQFVTPVQAEVAAANGVEEDEINHIRLSGKSRIKREVKIGDILFQIELNDLKTRINVYPPVTILRVQHRKEWSRIYHENNLDHEKIPWSTFEKSLPHLNLDRKILKGTCRSLSNDEYLSLCTIWKI